MISPSVGDYIRATLGDLDNSVWTQGHGLLSPSGWFWIWMRDGEPILGENEHIYQVKAEDVGKVISCEVGPIDQWERQTDPVYSDESDVVAP